MGMFLSTEKSGKVSNNLVGGLDCIVDSEGFSACRYGWINNYSRYIT